jgi:hypothetical protein
MSVFILSLIFPTVLFSALVSFNVNIDVDMTLSQAVSLVHEMCLDGKVSVLIKAL